jgi:hypothetical protein
VRVVVQSWTLLDDPITFGSSLWGCWSENELEVFSDLAILVLDCIAAVVVVDVVDENVVGIGSVVFGGSSL